MGTHPIFESDFDCLTEMNRISSIGTLCRHFSQCNRHKSSASIKSKIGKKTRGSSQLTKLGLNDPNTTKGTKVGSGLLDSLRNSRAEAREREMREKFDAMSEEEKLELAKEYQKALQEEYEEVLKKQRPQQNSTRLTKRTL